MMVLVPHKKTFATNKFVQLPINSRTPNPEDKGSMFLQNDRKKTKPHDNPED
jgi:hypothetical protein